jgi:hypothetical protein
MREEVAITVDLAPGQTVDAGAGGGTPYPRRLNESGKPGAWQRRTSNCAPAAATRRTLRCAPCCAGLRQDVGALIW